MISAVVLTRNESDNILHCLKTITWCGEIILIDNSTDDTVNRAKKTIPPPKLKIIHSSQDNFAYLRNLGLKKVRFNWVLFVDADHRVSPSLRSEIIAVLNNSTKNVAYRIKQQDVLFGRKFRFGETAHIGHVLLGQKTAGFWHRRVHEKWQIKGAIGEFKTPILHYPHQTLEEFIDHINRWSTLDALEFKNQGITAPFWQVMVYPVGKFLYNYFWRLGFLDGIPGFILAYVMSLHSLSVRIKMATSLPGVTPGSAALFRSRSKYANHMFKAWLPIIALLILFPLGHLVRWEFSPGIALYPQDVIVASLSLIVLFRFFKTKRLRMQPVAHALALFALAAMLSLVVNISLVTPTQALVGSLYLLRWLSYAGVFFYVREFIGVRPFTFKSRKYPLLNLLALSGVALTALGMAQYILHPDMRLFLLLGWDEHLYRLSGTILDPDFMGILLILTWFLIISLKLPKLTKIVAAILVLSGLFLTYSRASYLSWVAGSLVFLSLNKKLQYAFVGIAAFVLILTVLPKKGGSGVDLTRTFSIYARLVSWQEGIELYKRQPIFGHGFNLLRYKKQNMGLLPSEFELNHGATGIQNSYLFILATTGIVGFTTFGLFLHQLFKAKATSPQLFAAKQASLTAISIHALFTTTWVYPWVLLWLWLLCAASFKQGNT